MSASDIITGIALVLIIEGLVYALAPSFVERMLEALRDMPPEARRLTGLLSALGGVVLLWLLRG
ncbi:MAG: DUF2065 domain-containing protein [Pelagimonas sp.]|nr:DUF2065 domain-containing protein [Pelagimonas sp.]